MVEAKIGGRPKKPHVAKHVLVAEHLVEAAEAVREPGETFTAQVEDGLRRHIKARRKRQRPEG